MLMFAVKDARRVVRRQLAVRCERQSSGTVIYSEPRAGVRVRVCVCSRMCVCVCVRVSDLAERPAPGLGPLATSTNHSIRSITIALFERCNRNTCQPSLIKPCFNSSCYSRIISPISGGAGLAETFELPSAVQIQVQDGECQSQSEPVRAMAVIKKTCPWAALPPAHTTYGYFKLSDIHIHRLFQVLHTPPWALYNVSL